jgi:hypothetical protein
MVGYPTLLSLDIVLIEPQLRHAVGVDDILHTRWQHNVAFSGQHSIALGGSITLHWVAELIAFSSNIFGP